MGKSLEKKNLWAPWRINYIREIDKTDECFICHNRDNPREDDDNLVVWRGRKSIVVLNRYPYNNGHLLIAPLRHIAELDQADDDEMLEMTKLVRESQKALCLTIQPHGFNVGMNFGRCAGAGLPGHLHIHVVPRWNGDTNFINVCGDADVISQSLTELFTMLKEASKEHGLPAL
jgi:ATP adenylyltransferase